jgi:glucan biosynthesis protein C
VTDLTAPARPVAPTSAEKSRGSRLWFVDNLRVALICLVVLHHIVVTYSGLPLWYDIEKPTSPAVGLGLTVFLLVDQAWFMGAFFLLSGYFTPSSYERKGTGAFLRNRLIRLGVPLVVFYFVLQPILLLPAYDDGPLAHWYLSAIGSGPLWFVLVLLVLDTAYALTQDVTRRRPARENHEVAQPAPRRTGWS